MNGEQRLIAALLQRGEVWDLAGPEGQAIQRAEDGSAVVPLLCSREDAEALAREVYEDDTPRRHDVEETIDLLDDLVEEEAKVDADPRLVHGEWRSWRVPAQELLDDLLEALGRAGRDPSHPDMADLDRILELDVAERYEWFLSWVAVDDAAWALGDESALMTFPYEDGTSALVLFPHAAFAQRFAKERGDELEAYRLPWPHLLHELARAGEMDELVAVFPGADDHATVVEPARLREDLEQARREEQAHSEDGE